MKAVVYIESSVISYLTARPSRDVVTAARQAITSEWWDNHRQRYELYISALVEEEITSGDATAAQRRIEAVVDIPSLGITPEAQELAQVLLDGKGVPANSVEDALHIGIAATQGAEFLLTWNFKHINNAETKALIEKLVEDQGYLCPILCSPEELGG
ncbi:MAG: type II toxin-antitoxin system VapC family toxin [Candidatus Thiothrix singaporensis]|uniref:Type II toxin-antitoxin system VapC family toxin n=1 Tax=Candidatus Thiothrix singaporensis TaxID=2799669 RepID=A0A7L6AYA5_9GAMM|nr:MAG: type II toxin-antitoxin system VapC family toxin [Candidatus Thiothrix singaporensis]